jgi:hypothetical protein
MWLQLGESDGRLTANHGSFRSCVSDTPHLNEPPIPPLGAEPVWRNGEAGGQMINLERRAGLIVGTLLITHMVGSALVNFRLEAPLFGEPGFLVNAAAYGPQIGGSALIGIALGALFGGIAITVFPIVQAHSQTMALWLVVFGAVILALAVAEQASVMSMVTISEAYAKAPTTAREQFQTLRIVVAAARNWPHFLSRVMDGIAAFLFFATLVRFALVPRMLAAPGLLAAAMQITGVAMPLFGHDVVFLLLAPMGLAQLALALWLLVRGFGWRRT